MDTANLLKSLNHITPFHFLSRALPFRSSHFGHFKLKLKHKHFHLSLSSPTVCSLSERGNGSSLPCGVGEAVSQVSTRKLLQVVLVSPQIPGNTGCIARTCAASAVGLHLVGPLGFQVDDAKLKRAGLDYWPYPKTISGNRMGKSGCLRSPKEEQQFIRTFHTEEVTISYLAQKLVAYLLKLCWTAKVKPLAGVLFGFQWLKPMLDV
ncbi:uncharacterized protein LOC142615583 isoform X2 [Castanea sativa]|uniref:uncharacterized protein LOC142615583 isoform X2 n=1 Tax=Castanea sativa TaxID=21020 RepID=UPI003F650750